MATPSQVDGQSIAGHPPVQARPGSVVLGSSSIVGQLPLPYYDQTKGKRNN